MIYADMELATRRLLTSVLLPSPHEPYNIACDVCLQTLVQPQDVDFCHYLC